MYQRMRYYPEIVSVLIAEDQVMKALDFAIQNEVTGIRVRSLVENAELAKAKGEDIKASMLVKRIADLRKVSLERLNLFRWTSKNRSQVLVIDPCWWSD
jgi:hypothetical protein